MSSPTGYGIPRSPVFKNLIRWRSVFGNAEIVEGRIQTEHFEFPTGSDLLLLTDKGKKMSTRCTATDAADTATAQAIGVSK